MQLTLNDSYAEYLTGILCRTEFESIIFNYLLNNQDKTCLGHWRTEEYEDFLSWFYPRLRKSIDSYQEIGASFEAFLYKYFLIASREYRVRTVTNAVTEYSAWSARVPEMYTKEEPPMYNYNKTEDVITNLIKDKKGRKYTRRILALIIKCYYYMSEDFIEKIAPLIGIETGKLKEMLKKIQKIRQKKDDSIYQLKERIYCQFYRCIIYEKRVSLSQENTSIHLELTIKLDKAKQRLAKMRKRLSSIRTEATNKQVAEVIGITKGTVDASLSRLKLKWEAMAKKADLN